MNFKPSDFFIGLLEFFSIFLPGFVVTHLFHDHLFSIFQLHNSNSLIAFYFVASYILGHFVYGAGALLLEGLLILFKVDKNSAVYRKKIVVMKAIEIMNRLLKSGEDNENGHAKSKFNLKGEVHLQKWANSIIQIKHPDMLINVRQYEADAKFFRSFIIVSILGFFISITSPSNKWDCIYWLIAATFSVCLHFYRKFKAIIEVSNIIITMDSLHEFEKIPE